ncbi:hypothetical protein GUJ93_ZPchr0187g16419 [Zizania palustris]|uniref:glycerol-3-phosphate dehydrogenase n=1 Tax=Zizania palustris TaxID=103762 RepID=A0A8J5QMX3_ZIZPA|nr:hypothetical protein GUJ93_ZPchr0187g16419 [Zizania palustris]
MPALDLAEPGPTTPAKIHGDDAVVGDAHAGSVRRSDVLSAWSGIRPLAMDLSAKNTESISRDHVVFEDYPGLITITGGKWTTYRSMAADAVNTAIRSGNLKPANGCVTDHLHILGGYGWDPSSFTVLAQNYKRMKKTNGGKVIPGTMDSAVSNIFHMHMELWLHEWLPIAQVHSSYTP